MRTVKVPAQETETRQACKDEGRSDGKKCLQWDCWGEPRVNPTDLILCPPRFSIIKTKLRTTPHQATPHPTKPYPAHTRHSQLGSALGSGSTVHTTPKWHSAPRTMPHGTCR